MTTPNTIQSQEHNTEFYKLIKILRIMNTSNFYTPEATAKATFNRLYVVICSLRETTLTPDRRAWFEKTRDEFRYLLNIAKGYAFGIYENNVIANGADDFNEAELYYLGVTIPAPSLHYGA